MLRCLDLDDQIHAIALDCARYILLITAKYEGHTAVTDPQLDDIFNKMKAPDCQNYTSELASVSFIMKYISTLFEKYTQLLLCFLSFCYFIN